MIEEAAGKKQPLAGGTFSDPHIPISPNDYDVFRDGPVPGHLRAYVWV